MSGREDKAGRRPEKPALDEDRGDALPKAPERATKKYAGYSAPSPRTAVSGDAAQPSQVGVTDDPADAPQAGQGPADRAAQRKEPTMSDDEKAKKAGDPERKKKPPEEDARSAKKKPGESARERVKGGRGSGTSETPKTTWPSSTE